MIEDGLIRPEDLVSKYLPEFAELQVAVLKEPVDENISPRRIDRDDHGIGGRETPWLKNDVTLTVSLLNFDPY